MIIDLDYDPLCVCDDCVSERVSRAYLAGWEAGREAAAGAVSAHWNDSVTMTNQRGQAERSARSIRALVPPKTGGGK